MHLIGNIFGVVSSNELGEVHLQTLIPSQVLMLFLYYKLLLVWQEFKYLSKSNNLDYNSEILWNNCKILIEKKHVFYTDWYINNIV